MSILLAAHSGGNCMVLMNDDIEREAVILKDGCANCPH